MSRFWLRIPEYGSNNEPTFSRVNGQLTISKKWPEWNSSQIDGISMHNVAMLADMSKTDYLTKPFSGNTKDDLNHYFVAELILDEKSPFYNLQEDSDLNDPILSRGLAHYLLRYTPNHDQKVNRRMREIVFGAARIF